jgi:hypothetical protein
MAGHNKAKCKKRTNVDGKDKEDLEPVKDITNQRKGGDVQ